MCRDKTSRAGQLARLSFFGGNVSGNNPFCFNEKFRGNSGAQGKERRVKRRKSRGI